MRTTTPETYKRRLSFPGHKGREYVPIQFARKLERENQLLRDELEQQAICNGAGASRELSLRTTIDALQKELCVLRERIVKEGYIVTNFDGTIELAIDPWHKREKEVKP